MIISPVRYNHTRLSSQDTQLTEDALDLLSFKKQGHMECWEYASADYEGDPAGGAEHWANLVHSPGDYYLTKGDIKTIQSALDNQQLANLLSDIETVVELGPGSYDSIYKKTLPFLGSCKSIETYAAIDATVGQAKDATSIVQKSYSLNTRALEANYMASPLKKTWYGKSALIMWGSSLGNIDGSAGEDPFLKLVKTLKNFRTGLDKEDLLIVCFDTEMNEENVVNAYSELSLRAQILSIVHLLKRDGIVTGQFDPRMWHHQAVWFPKVAQCAHVIYPIFEQVLNIAGIKLRIPAWRRFISNNSYKFSPKTVDHAASKAGIRPLMCISNGPIAMFVGQAA